MGYTRLIVKPPQVNGYFVSSGGIDFSKSNSIMLNSKMIEDIEKKYKKNITRWQDEFKIDAGIINSFICIESGGKNAPRNSAGAIGLMQVTAPTVYEVLTKWNVNVKVPLSEKTKSFFNNKVSLFSKWSANKAMSTAERTQIESALLDPEFNIAVGTATVRWLFEWYAKNGSAELFKVIVSYNAGFYGTRNKVKDMSIENVLAEKAFRKETQSYVMKMLGVKGFLDLYYNVLDK